jgi:hypothetical protein
MDRAFAVGANTSYACSRLDCIPEFPPCGNWPIRFRPAIGESEEAFSRAFKRATGLSPARWRDDEAARAAAGG